MLAKTWAECSKFFDLIHFLETTHHPLLDALENLPLVILPAYPRRSLNDHLALAIIWILDTFSFCLQSYQYVIGGRKTYELMPIPKQLHNTAVWTSVVTSYTELTGGEVLITSRGMRRGETHERSINVHSFERRLKKTRASGGFSTLPAYRFPLETASLGHLVASDPG